VSVKGVNPIDETDLDSKKCRGGGNKNPGSINKYTKFWSVDYQENH